MAGRAESHPTPIRALAAPKLNTAMNSNLLRVLILEPLQILTCLLVIYTLTLKLRFKAAYLSLKARYFSFKISKLVASKRKLMLEYRRRAVLGNQFLNAIDDSHNVCDVVMPNDPSSATRPTGHVDCNRSAMAGFAAALG